MVANPVSTATVPARLGAVGGERGRAADEHRAPQRHPVGRSQAALPGTDEGHRQQDGAERACCEGSDPAADLEPHRCRKGRQQATRASTATSGSACPRRIRSSCRNLAPLIRAYGP